MNKPPHRVYEEFVRRYETLNRKEGRAQYLVPYFISSHPGCTLDDAIELAEYIRRTGHRPEQVQDFYPTPGTLSTCMYYTGLDPRTMESRLVPGFYACGEVLDIDGDCGGYNLQWAWSSGRAAGLSI